MPIFALLLYGKNEQVNPTPDQTRAIMAVVGEFRARSDRLKIAGVLTNG